MNRSNTKRNTTSLKLIEWLLDQLQSEGEFDTIIRQLETLVLPQQGKSTSTLYAHISHRIFEQYLVNPDDLSAKLYARLCHSLFLASIKPIHNSGGFNQTIGVHDYLFALCVRSQPLEYTADRPETTNTGVRSDSIRDAGAGLRENIATIIDIKTITSLVSSLFGYGLISVAQVYQFISQLIAPSPTSPMERALPGICTLLEAHGLFLNATPWEGEMRRLLEWAKAEIIIALGGSWGRELLAEHREKTFPSPTSSSEEVLNENNYGRHIPVHEPIATPFHHPTETLGSTEFESIETLNKLGVITPPIANNPTIQLPVEAIQTPEKNAETVTPPVATPIAATTQATMASTTASTVHAASDRHRAGLLDTGIAPPLQRQVSIGLGLGGVGRLANRGGFPMRSSRSPSASGDGSIPLVGGAASRLTPMSRSASQGSIGGEGPRETTLTHSQRRRNPGDNVRASGSQTLAQMGNFEPLMPLEQSENRWAQQVEERQLVDQKVKALLNEFTMEKFDSISDQIIEWANKSEQEKDGSTLMQVVKLVFEKAKDEAAFSEMYARLCHRMMERVSPNVQDETIKNFDGRPVTGGMLFRKYLLNRCQEDFERGWSTKEAALAAAALKLGEDKAAEAASGDSGEAALYSEEYYAAAKAKRQGLGLVRFIGELFKLQMLTERIMSECIKKLLSNVVNPEEEEIESLCELLTTIGQSFDKPKTRNHMDIYFERMQDMAKSSNINPRMQSMLLDVIELRARHWQTRSALPRPPPTHQDSSCGRSPRGEQRGVEPDGWNVASGTRTSRSSARAEDLSQFGKISKPTGIQFGPSSVFNKKDASKRDSSIGRAGGNMYLALSTGASDGPPPPVERTASSRKPSIDLGSGGSPATASTGKKRKLILLPRTKPTEAEAGEAGGKGDTTPTTMTEEEAQTKVKDDEYLGVEDIDEAIVALETLPSEHRHLFVDKLVDTAMDGGNKVVVLAEKLFSAARSRSVISPEGFERGLLPTIEMADDLSIDVPKTYEWLARMIHAAGLDKAKTEEMAGKISVYGEPRVPPRELLVEEFGKLPSV